MTDMLVAIAGAVLALWSCKWSFIEDRSTEAKAGWSARRK